MGNVKIKKKAEIEQEKQLAEQIKVKKEKFKNKDFKTLSTKEKDELLERIARALGYL